MATAHPSWRYLRLLAVAVLAYLILLCITAPAWLLGRVLPAGPAASYSGSLWQGQARQLQLGEQTLQQLRWQWQFPLQWQLEGESPRLRFSARLSPGLAEQQLQQLEAEMKLDNQPLATVSASLVRFTANACLQADNMHWQLTGTVQQLLAGQADTDGLLYCDAGELKLDASQLRLTIGLQHYQPVITQRWVAPQYRNLLR